MLLPAYTGSDRRIITSATLACALLFMSCASLKPGLNSYADETKKILEVEHLHSRRSSDCLGKCVEMVLQYYGVDAALPDSALPLELTTLIQFLNDEMLTDSQGYRLFATALELSTDEIATQIDSERPLILVYKPHAQKVYHSVVISGYFPERNRYYSNNPIRKKPSWISLKKIPAYQDSGKYLVMLVGLHDS